MRVLLIHNHYQQPGGEDAVVELERRTLERRGVPLAAYTQDNDEITSYSLAQKAMLPLSAISSKRTRSELRTLIAQFRPDVAYVHNLYPLISPAAYTVLAEEGVPVVQVMHNFRPFCQNGLLHTRGAICERCIGGPGWPGLANRCFRGSFFLSAMYAAATARARACLPSVSAFIAMTRFGASKLQHAGIPASRISVRPNFIECAPETPAYNPGSHALFLGRLTPEKGLWTLLDAAALTPWIPIVIAGGGPDDLELRSAVQQRELHHVRFAGFVQSEVKRQLLRDAMFVVAPSECYENFPVTVLESFGAGKPVVASDLGGIPHIVSAGQTGLLFPARDHVALSRRMSALAESPELRTTMGRAARAQVEREYNPERWFQRTMQIFSNAAPNVRPVVEALP